MRIQRVFFSALIAPCLLATGFAGDWVKQEPEVLAKEARKTAEQLRETVKDFQSEAIKAGRTLSADEKKYLDLSIEEAKLSEKSAKAWENNQKRMAEKLREDIGEVCKKRGTLAEKLKLWDEKKSVKKSPSDQADSAKVAEIESQQAELEKKKQEILEKKKADR